MKFKDVFEGRSGAYRFTCVKGNPDHEMRLSILKQQVKDENKQAVPEPDWGDTTRTPVQRVVLKGRLGKNNPNAHLYRKGGPLHSSSSQDIKPEHSTHFDVYVRHGWKR